MTEAISTSLAVPAEVVMQTMGRAGEGAAFLPPAALNRGEADGFFDYDYRYGRLVFRMTFNFKGGKLLRETLVYMIVSACNKVNALNGRIMYAAMSPEPYKAFTAYAG